MRSKSVVLRNIRISNTNPFVWIGGPCVIESDRLVFDVARKLKAIAQRHGLPYIFKSSYDKANRSSLKSFRGPGLVRGLDVLRRVKEKFGVPLLTDVHTPVEAREAAKVVDILQVPAFLCRQTDLIVAVAKTGRIVNIKKGQFMSPWEVKNVIQKIESTGNKQILLTERGTSFGYNNLVVDMRSLDVMKKTGYPVVYDATHSVQLPAGQGHASGGQGEFIYPLAKAAVGVGIGALFMEIHPNPAKALSDGPNSLELKGVEKMIARLKKIDRTIKRMDE